MDDAGGGGEFRQEERRRRNGEFDQPIGALEQRRDIADDLDAVPPKAGELAGVAADDSSNPRLPPLRQA